MAVYRRSNRHRFILILLVLTSITLLTLDTRAQRSGTIGRVRATARDALAPVQSAVHAVTDPVGNFISSITHYGSLKAENVRLKRQLEAAESRRLRTADAERERTALLALAQLTFAEDIPTVAARVVSTAPSNFQLTIDIGRGTAAGVEKGMPVVTALGLVGRVVEVSRREATVLLVTDPAFNVGVRLTDSGDVGVAHGNGSRQALTVDLIDVGTKVSRGEVVVTSGLQQSIFPPSIPVGRVRSASARPGALQQDVRVDPVVDLRRLQFVRVLRWQPHEKPQPKGAS